MQLRSITSIVTSAMLAFFLIGTTVVDHSASLKIYNDLRQCYRGNNTDHWIASSLQNFLELIRKVESAYPTSIDMRMLAVAILHRLRIDGIQRAPGVRETEYTIPYGVGGTMAPKFQIILNSISDTSSPINFTEVLTPLELCTFHRLVSSTIEPSIRGDESRTCSPNLSSCNDGFLPTITNKVTTFPNGKVLIIPGDVSTCPEEMGVVRTFNYGSFSPGEVIAAIAAGLQPQSVQIRDLISAMNKDFREPVDSEKIEYLAQRFGEFNNKNVAGLAGDLAEVCVFQAPYYGENVSVGLNGYWDDMLLPKARYLTNEHYKLWQLTDSEILAGIDAYHFAMNIKGWVDRIPTLRLSQVVEMFYSSRGIPTAAIENRPKMVHPVDTMDQIKSENVVKEAPKDRVAHFENLYYDGYLDTYSFEDSLDSACERRRILERISARMLKEETFKLAQILQLSVPLIGITDDLLFSACNAAVDRFHAYATSLLNGLPNCKNIPSNYHKANVDLTMILDGSRNETQVQKLIGAVSELIDVSIFGSDISVIHGGSIEVLVTRTNSILNAFEELRYYPDNYPGSFSLSTSLSKVVQMFSTYDENSTKNGTICEKSRVVLIFSQGQKITDDDFKNADWLFSGSLKQFLDVYYIFVTNDRKAFEELTKNVTPADRFNIIETTDLEPKTFLAEIGKIVRQIPKRLIVPSCGSSSTESEIPQQPIKYEDYVSPNQVNYYQINPKYLYHLPDLRISFEGASYGTFTVCMIRESKQCQSTTNLEVLEFVLSQSCQGDDVKSCSPVTFAVELDTSKMRCAESDCRYPDQIRYQIGLYSSECSPGSANRQFNCAVFFLLLALMLSLLNVL